MPRLTRLTKDLVRVVEIDGRQCVLTIGLHGLTLRSLGDWGELAVPLRWADLAREGGLLDEAELAQRPLLAAVGTMSRSERSAGRSAGRQRRGTAAT